MPNRNPWVLTFWSLVLFALGSLTVKAAIGSFERGEWLTTAIDAVVAVPWLIKAIELCQRAVGDR